MISIFRTIVLIAAIWCLVSALGLGAIGAYLLRAADNPDAVDMAWFIVKVGGIVGVIDCGLWGIWNW